MSSDRVRVFSSPVVAGAAVVVDHLDAHGITATMTGAHLSGLGGLVPFTETWVEVWVDDAEADEAKQLVTAFLEPPEQGRLSTAPDGTGGLSLAPRLCPSCGAESEEGFDLCWQCGEDLEAPGA